MDILVVHVLNALLYASVMFLIAGGLSLIYGVMRIVNLAHGNLYAFGAYVTAWAVGTALGGATEASFWMYALLPVGAIAAAALGAVLEPTLLRPLYRRAEEYQLLITFGLLLILEDVMRLVWGPYPLQASALYEGLGSLTFGDSIYPTYNLVVIVIGGVAAAGLWAFVYRTQFGVVLRATSQNMRMASALGVNVNRVYVQAFTLGCFMAGLGGSVIVPQQGAVLGMGVDALILAFVVVVIGGLGSLTFGESIYPTYNLVVIVIGGVAAAGLWAFVYRTQFGVVLRATSQNMRMASALGVNVNRVYVQAFTLGCFMAGLGGAIIVPSQSAVLGMGVDALILAFIVVVIGGLGSLEGALVGALIVGVVREMGITWFPEIELAVLYLMAALVLLVRPAGIFGRP
jgi:branched-chain amino acid transport system permease protein